MLRGFAMDLLCRLEHILRVQFKNKTKKQGLPYISALQCVNIGLDECNCGDQIWAWVNITYCSLSIDLSVVAGLDKMHDQWTIITKWSLISLGGDKTLILF